MSGQSQVKAWVAQPVCHIHIRSEDGFINYRVRDEYNPILNELAHKELDRAGIHAKIYQKLIAGFDYDPLTRERTFRYRRMVGAPNPEKLNITLMDGTPITVIAAYDF
jgi:hypothetical protein